MRLLFVYQFCSIGGVETVLRNRLAGLRAIGADPSVLFLRDAGGRSIFADESDVEILTDPAGARDFLADRSFDVVSAIDTPEIYPTLREIGHTGRVVTEVHANTRPSLQYLDEIADSGTDRIVTPSHFEASWIQREFPEVRRADIPIEVVPNPVDVELFRPHPEGPEPPGPVLLWVGRLEPEKNWPGFLELASLIADEHPTASFLMVGGGRSFADVKAELRWRIDDHGLGGRVRWLSTAAYERMPSIYSTVARSGGCLVPTSAAEPFGMTLIEAMSCGCPVVAPDAGAFPEIVADGATGLLFSLSDTRQAAASVSRMIGDAALREALATNARRRVDDEYAPTPVARRLVEAITPEGSRDVAVGRGA